MFTTLFYHKVHLMYIYPYSIWFSKYISWNHDVLCCKFCSTSFLFPLKYSLFLAIDLCHIRLRSPYNHLYLQKSNSSFALSMTAIAFIVLVVYTYIYTSVNQGPSTLHDSPFHNFLTLLNIVEHVYRLQIFDHIHLSRIRRIWWYH